jgi:hypothetical protein
MVDHDQAQTIWTTQPQETFTMSVDEIRTRAATFQGRISARNWREQAVGALMVAVFLGLALVLEHTLTRIALLTGAAGTLCVIWQLHRQAHAASIDELCLVNDWRQFHRAELVRQRDALRTVWRWYLGPLIPGGILGYLAAAQGYLQQGNIHAAIAFAVMGPLAMAVLFSIIARLNKKAANAIDGEIRQLDK